MKWYLAALLFPFLASFGFGAEALAAPPQAKIAIQPLGKVSKELVEETRKAMERLYDVEVVTLAAAELPAEAYYKPRGRYRAEKLLDWLQTKTDASYTKVVGITQVDISTSKGEIYDWGIFGLAYLGQRPCVVSNFRLSKKVTKAQMLDRFGKVVGHEVGHTFGLEHCPVVGCLMADAEGKVSTVDNEKGELCEGCRKRVPTLGVRRER